MICVKWYCKKQKRNKIAIPFSYFCSVVNLMVNYVKKLAVNLAVKAEDVCTFICLFSSFTAKVNEN